MLQDYWQKNTHTQGQNTNTRTRTGDADWNIKRSVDRQEERLVSLEDRPGLRALCPLVFVCVESRTQLEIVNRARRLCSAMHIVDARCASQFLFGSQSSFSVRHHKAKKKTKKMQLRNCDGRDYMEKKMPKPLSESAFYQWKSFDYTYFWINDARPEPTAKDLITYSWMCVACAFKKNPKNPAINLPLILCDFFTRRPCHVTVTISALPLECKERATFSLSVHHFSPQTGRREGERERATRHNCTTVPHDGRERKSTMDLDQLKGSFQKVGFVLFFLLVSPLLLVW